MKLSQFVAALAWSSVIAEMWLLLMRTIPSDGLAWSSLVLFFVIAIFASVAGGNGEPPPAGRGAH